MFYFEGPKGSVQHFDFKFVSMKMIYNFDLQCKYVKAFKRIYPMMLQKGLDYR